jgi:hypothetical protein
MISKVRELDNRHVRVRWLTLACVDILLTNPSGQSAVVEIQTMWRKTGFGCGAPDCGVSMWLQLTSRLMFDISPFLRAVVTQDILRTSQESDNLISYN